MLSELDHLIQRHRNRLESVCDLDPYRSQRLKLSLQNTHRHSATAWRHWRTALVSVVLFVVLTIVQFTWIKQAFSTTHSSAGSDPLLTGLAPKTVSTAYTEVMPWSN